MVSWENYYIDFDEQQTVEKATKETEGVARIEFFIMLYVSVMFILIMPRCKRTNLLVPDAELLQCFLEDRQRLFLTVSHFVGKLKPIICLDTLNGIGKLLPHA